MQYSHEDHDAVEALLMGHRVTKVDDSKLVLDDGTVLELVGAAECCMEYKLTELNGTDNIITRVEFRDDPAGDDQPGEGVYQIFVYSGHTKINLATFEGDDSNGYYGTGYTINVTAPK